MENSSEDTKAPNDTRRHRFIRALKRILSKILLRIKVFSRLLLGEFHWTAPHWIRRSTEKTLSRISPHTNRIRIWIGDHRKQTMWACGSLTLFVVASSLAYQWYQNLPKPISVSITVRPPGLTAIEVGAKPQPVSLSFSAPSAPLKDLNRVLTQGVQIDPPQEGRWHWENDRTLIFEPSQDWPIDKEFNITIDKGSIAPQVQLSQSQVAFRTKPFAATLFNTEFYQNPANPREKKVVVSLRFSHPVNLDSLNKRVSLEMKGQKEALTSAGRTGYGFQVLPGKLNGEAYIHSDLIQIPDRDSSMAITIAPGVEAIRGGNGTPAALSTKINIPGMYNFFKIEQIGIHLIPNDKFESDQVLSVQMTADVQEQDFKNGLSVYLLPEHRGENRKRHWQSATEITPQILAQSRSLQLEMIPNERDASPIYNFKFTAPVGRDLLVKIPKGTKSVGDYILSNDYIDIKRVPPFPAEVRLMHDGAILSYTGERKLGGMARGLPGVHFKIGRVIPEDIGHLITQTDGTFKSPSFQNSMFNEENITEKFEETRSFGGKTDGKVEYFTFDLGKYLNKGANLARQKGLFFLNIEGWDPVNKTSMGYRDTRFILVTDLGVILKKMVDQSNEVYVMSFRSGLPVSAAQVEVIGKNGLTLLTANTDLQGRASFPTLKDFREEKLPVGFIVKKGNDLSFLPIGHSDRRLSFSRFDVGGVSSSIKPEKLSAYLFSERGLYRPGDEFHIGMIVRSQDWSSPLEGVPLEVAVTDPRGLQTHKERFQLTQEGFSEFTQKTEESSPTGVYGISLFLIAENERRVLLGSTSIRVEEFLPDTMKILTHLSGERVEGWVSPKDLKAQVSLRNLFGTPAENRRVTASISLTPFFPTFKKFREYHFFDSLKPHQAHSESLNDSTTNLQGEADFNLGLDRFEKGTYHLTFNAEGFAAEGGRSVGAASSVLVSPLQFLIGYKSNGDLGYIKKNSKRSVEFIAIDSELKKHPVSDLSLQLVQVKTLSILARQSDGTFRYESIRKEVPLETTKFTIQKSGYVLSLKTQNPGDFLVTLRDKEGLEVSHFDYSIVGETNVRQKLERNAELQIKLAKTDVLPGQELEFQMTSPYTGAGIITIEREKVLAVKWFKANTTNSVQRIRIPENLEGGAYVNVAFVRDLASKEIFTSPLCYGVVPFSVSREKRVNRIQIDHSELLKPGEPLTIRYQAQNPSKIVIFAVDEGILQVARYKTPDPLAEFFKKRALEVDTQQLLDLLLPEYNVSKMLSASGGDEGANAIGKNLNPFRRKRDKPVVYWSGLIDASPTEKSVTYQIPDYFNGTLRIVAIAAASDSIGVFEDKATVRGDFVITPTVPLFSAPGDEFVVGVSLANNVDGSGDKAQVKLDIESSEHLQVEPPTSQTLTVGEGREVATTFKVHVKDVLGSGHLTFRSSFRDKTSKYGTDLSVRPSVPYQVVLTTGRTKDTITTLDLKGNLYKEFREQNISLSTVPVVLSHGLLKYLDNYPYGCTEQLVSKAFPIIVLKERPEFGIVPASVDQAFKEIIHTLRSRQGPEGAYGIWSANSETSDFYTDYVYHFLTELRDRGMPGPKEMYSRTEGYLKSLLQRDPKSLDDARVWAYSLYLLARNGILAGNELIALRKHLDEEFKNLWSKDLTAAYLAGTYKLYHQDEEAQRLISQMKLGDPQKSNYGYLYDSLVRDGELLYILAKHFPEMLKALDPNSLDSLTTPLMQGQYNTISSAYTVLGLDAYASVVGQPSQNPAFSLSEYIQGWSPLQLQPGLFSKLPISDNALKIQITNQSNTPLFYQNVQAGFDKEAPTTEIKKRLEVFREIVDSSGKLVTTAQMGEQYDVHVRARSVDSSTLTQIAVVDLLPGGFEVVMEHHAPSNESQEDGQTHDSSGERTIDDGSSPGQEERNSEGDGDASIFQFLKLPLAFADEQVNRNPASAKGMPGLGAILRPNYEKWIPQYVDIREDRVLIFGSVDPSAKEFVYRIKAVNRGNFTVPPIFAESMYDRSIQGRGLGSVIQVDGK